MNLASFIVPLGITTYALALVTIISGLLQVKLSYHKLLAFLVITLATCHAALVIYLEYFAGR